MKNELIHYFLLKNYQFEIFESKLKNMVAPINHEMLINLLNDFKNKINL